MNILSIQSSVARGYVGNSVAVPALQALGLEVWRIDTVCFSNHPAHGGFRGRVAAASEIDDLVQGLHENGGLQTCAALLSGYLGALEQGRAMMAALANVRAANPQAQYALDPVIGDAGRIYVKPGIAEFLRDEAIPHADIVTPNAFELGFLTRRSIHDTGSALAAIDTLRSRMRGENAQVVATGLVLRDQPADTLAILGSDATDTWRVIHPAVDHPAYGAGDLFAALLLGRLLNGETAGTAAAKAATVVHGVIAATLRHGGKDLRLIACRDTLAASTAMFGAERLR